MANGRSCRASFNSWTCEATTSTEPVGIACDTEGTNYHYVISLTHCGLVMAYGIWRHISESTLVQTMAWCLTAPSHYLNQRWLIISEILWHAPQRNFTVIDQVDILYSEFENYNFKITATPRRGQWVSRGHISESKLIIMVMCPTAPMAMKHPPDILTYWGRGKMAAVSQTTLPNAFSWIKWL